MICMVHCWILPLVFVFISIFAILAATVIYGKYHNPIEVAAAKLIEHETGINVDSMLPDDVEPKICAKEKNGK